MRMVTVDLLRHGHVDGPNCFRGETDDPLSDLGWRQMRFACPPDQARKVVLTSPLRRCRSFADELALTSGMAPIIDAGLSPTKYGEWEGRSAVEIHAAMPETWRAYQQDPFGFRPPGGESVLDVAARARSTLLRILTKSDIDGVLLITHSNVILGIIAGVMGMPKSHWGYINIGHGSFSRIQFVTTPNGWNGKLIAHLGLSPIR